MEKADMMVADIYAVCYSAVEWYRDVPNEGMEGIG